MHELCCGYKHCLMIKREIESTKFAFWFIKKAFTLSNELGILIGLIYSLSFVGLQIKKYKESFSPVSLNNVLVIIMKTCSTKLL